MSRPSARAPLASVPPLPAAPTGGQGVRSSKAADGLEELVPDALAALKQVLTQAKAQRHVSSKVAAAKYVLDIALDRVVPESSNAPELAAAKLTPAQAMAELQRRLKGDR